MAGDTPPRRPLHERSESDSNTPALAAVRLVPPTPPRPLGERDDVFSRTPLPTHPAHILLPGKGRDDALQYEFQRTSKARSSTSSSGSTTHQPPQYSGSPIGASSRPKPVAKKRLQLHKGNKTFSLVPLEHPRGVEPTPISPSLSTESSYSFLSSDARNSGVRSEFHGIWYIRCHFHLCRPCNSNSGK